MTDELDRLRDAVVQAADAWERAYTRGTFDDYRLNESDVRYNLRMAVTALRAHPAQRATAETVRVAVWTYPDGSLRFAVPNSQEDSYPTVATRLGTTTLRLDTEAADGNA